jgi:hypothetical protein
MRRPVVLGIVLALAAGGIAGWAVHVRLADPPPACAVPATAPDKPRAAAGTAPGGGGLHLVEQGFTNLNSGASYGAIVENTSTSVAYRTRVTFSFSNKGDQIQQVPSPRATQEIPVIQPGQRIGVGTTEALAPPHSAAAVELHLGDTTWLTREELGDLSPVTASVTHSEHPNADYPGYLKITYTSSTAACRQLAWRGVATVVRNQSGTIIGGALDSSADGCATGTHVTSPLDLLPVADDTRTQVFPYCDVQRPAESVTNQIAN